MAILERHLQKVMTGKWDELEQIDQEWTTIEERYGYPDKTRYTYISGPHDIRTLVVERLWDSMADWEAAAKKLQNDPESKELSERTDVVIQSAILEILWKLE